MTYILGVITGVLLCTFAAIFKIRTQGKAQEVEEKVEQYGKIKVMGEVIEETDDDKSAFVETFSKESDL